MIRKATVEDFAEIMKFVPMMKTQALFEYDESKVRREIFGTILSGQAFVAITDGQIVGTAAYAVEAAWYSSKCALYDKWMAVSKPHRAKPLAGKLILALEKEAERLRVPFLPGISGDLSNSKVFERRYKKVGVQYMKDCANVL